MRQFIPAAFLALFVTACTTVESAQLAGEVDVTAQNARPSSKSDSAAEGLSFAQIHCAGCHGVTGGQISATNKAPPFEAIANMRGLTDNTLSAWLRDSHNYPGQMNFEIDAQHIDNLAAHILTLRSADYQPPIQ